MVAGVTEGGMVVGEFGPLGHNLHQGMVVLGALLEFARPKARASRRIQAL